MFIYTDFQHQNHRRTTTRRLTHSSLIFTRCRRPRRLAAPVTTRDGKAMQYVSSERIDHVAGEDDPSSAVDRRSAFANLKSK